MLGAISWSVARDEDGSPVASSRASGICPGRASPLASSRRCIPPICPTCLFLSADNIASAGYPQSGRGQPAAVSTEVATPGCWRNTTQPDGRSTAQTAASDQREQPESRSHQPFDLRLQVGGGSVNVIAGAQNEVHRGAPRCARCASSSGAVRTTSFGSSPSAPAVAHGPTRVRPAAGVLPRPATALRPFWRPSMVFLRSSLVFLWLRCLFLLCLLRRSVRSRSGIASITSSISRDSIAIAMPAIGRGYRLRLCRLQQRSPSPSAWSGRRR